MVEVKFSLDKVVLALPKIISGFFNAIESSVESVLRTEDAAKARWTVDRLEKLNVFLNKVMVGPAGLRHAVTQYCDDPTPENWGLIATKLDESAVITKEFRKSIEGARQPEWACHIGVAGGAAGDCWICGCRRRLGRYPPSFRDGPKDQTSDAQLRIGESRDSGFLLRRPRNDTPLIHAASAFISL